MKIKIVIFYWTLGIISNMVAQSLVIEPIESSCLHQERRIFQNFVTVFGAVDSFDVIKQSLIQKLFDQEEQDYLGRQSHVLFFHALLDDQVVGYISCNLIDPNNIYVRQLAVDPEIFTTNIIKEMLLAVFENYPKTQSITIPCLAPFQEMVEFLTTFGFVKLENQQEGTICLYDLYELKIGFKCKICELLYPNLWIDDPDEEVDTQESQETEFE